MDSLFGSARPEYKVRQVDGGHFVIDARWPYGSVIQLAGLFATRAYALRWLLESGEIGQ